MELTITAPLYVNEAWGGDVQSDGASVVGTWVTPGTQVEAPADLWEHFQCHATEGWVSASVEAEPEPEPAPAEPEVVEGAGTIAEARFPEGSVGASRRRRK